MLRSVEFMSLKAFKLLMPCADAAVISIRDSSTVRGLPTFAGFREVLQRAQVQRGPMLWLVVDQDHQERLAGVLSPFELM